MDRIINYFNQYSGQSKYDYRGNSRAYTNRTVLISDPKAKSYDEVNGQENFTLYAGIDPEDKSRALIRKMVWVPVDLGKYGGQSGFYCLEEVNLTRNFMQKHP